VPLTGYLLQLPAASSVSAVVWSYDRRGERYDTGASPREILVETSTDGLAWQKAARTPVRPDSLHGHAVPLDRPLDTQWARITFLDTGGKPVHMPCDEMEVY
jgi:hypothetical protein